MTPTGLLAYFLVMSVACLVSCQPPGAPPVPPGQTYPPGGSTSPSGNAPPGAPPAPPGMTIPPGGSSGPSGSTPTLPPTASDGALTPSGQTPATSCPTAKNTACAANGTTNYVSRNLVYNQSTGKFTGTMVTNLCSNNHFGTPVYGTGNGATSGPSTSDCFQQQFPAPIYVNNATPSAAALRGTIAYSMYGVYVYGPLEAGFTTGFACSNNEGSCPSGADLDACAAQLVVECGGMNNVIYGALPDTCGGHAMPYHYHGQLKCDTTKNQALISATDAVGNSGHSPIVAIALDGYGMYGQYESTNQTASTDACGGHYGPVPVPNGFGGVTVSTDPSTYVYHYHQKPVPPYTLGCYGPAKTSSVTECQGLYATCNSGFTTMQATATTNITYDTDCPCYLASGSQQVSSTSAPAVSTSITISPSVASTPSPSGVLVGRLPSVWALAAPMIVVLVLSLF